MQHLQILWVTRSKMAPDAGVKPHAHPYYHMFYIHSGSFRFSVNGQDHCLQPGDVLLVPPQTEHSYICEAPVAGEYLEIKFARPRPQAAEPQLQLCNDPLAGQLFSQILREYSEVGALADDAATAYLNALLHLMGRDQRCQKQSHQFRYLDADSFTPLARRLVRYLEAHYSEDLSLDDLAQAMDYNKSYLCAAFKKDTNQTIADCLNMIRIRRAAELIVYSEHSLTQVSQLCGFSSVSHFNRVFLKYAGITPRQARRAYPANILFGFPDRTQKPASPSENFMYSVLARKRITPDMMK